MNVYEHKIDSDEDSATASVRKRAANNDARQAAAQTHTFVVRALRRFAKVLLPLAVVAAGYFGYAYLKATRPETAKRPVQERVFAVNVIKAEQQTVQPKIKLYGTTVAGRRVDIRALVAGRVIETSPELKNGGVVEKGDMLLKIDPFSYRNAAVEAEAQLSESRARIEEFKANIATEEASLESVKQQLKIAERDLGRAKPLARRGTVSQRTVDEREQVVLQRQQDRDRLSNTLSVWKARIAQQKAIIARQEAALALAQRRLEETELVAPFDAYITEVSSQVGRMVSANDKVATLIDRDWIEVRFTLNNEQFGRILAGGDDLEGRRVDVIWSLGSKTVTYQARVERVAAEVTAATGGVEVVARIDNPIEPIPLRTGAFVEVLIPDQKFTGVVRVPPSALYEGDTVYVSKDGRLEARKIEVAGSVGDDVLVRGPIEDGAAIVTTRISTPGNGVRVREVN